MSIKEYAQEMIDMDPVFQDMYVVTNRNDVYGASVVFYPGFIEKMSEKMVAKRSHNIFYLVI